ncbi:MAG: hypothetical protein F2947_02550 [Actinobacteria bacterium]|nr:hypothetical protein [Actinomycetota bacterium]MSW31600.1 hypothetical protein [Actinomycetota bacterium]MSX33584.1 hypothetical protein [Actinomycetota bacterium]MSX95898.1 hypothetical protein [Actinomycetota bacterium]MSY24392.1 hypothetical protein [Actinomycetota bacterium]
METAHRVRVCHCLRCRRCRSGVDVNGPYASSDTPRGRDVTAWIIVGLAGALGATSRHAVDIGLRRWFPKGPSIGILVVNLLGSFVLGIVVGVVATRTIDENLRLGVAAGFCGAFTTFSTFAAELAGLVNDRNHRMVLQWTAMMVLGGGLAAYAGIVLGRL